MAVLRIALIKQDKTLSITQHFKKLLFGDLALHLKNGDIFESDDSEHSAEEVQKIEDAPDTERCFFN